MLICRFDHEIRSAVYECCIRLLAVTDNVKLWRVSVYCSDYLLQASCYNRFACTSQ